jgi:hypothetical protein
MTRRKRSVMEETMLFVFAYERDKQRVTEMCLKFGIAWEIG